MGEDIRKGIFMAYSAELRRQFKASARERIRENFWPTMAAVVLGMLPGMLVTMIYEQAQSEMMILLYAAAMIFVVVPMQFGMMHYYVARARGQEASISVIFSCFGSARTYRNALVTALAIFVRSVGWWVLEAAVIGAYAVVVMQVAVVEGGTIQGALIAALVVLSVVLIVVSAVVGVKLRRYDAAYIRMIDDPEGSAWEATGECVEVFRDHNWELFVFDASFILWALGTIVTLGVLGIYLEAYMNMAYVRYFDALRQCKTGMAPPQEPESLPPMS